MSCNLRIIHERNVRPPASQVSPTLRRADNSFSEYSLKQNVFDPSKSSPPNEFIKKLELRIKNYTPLSNIDNREIE